MRFLATARSLCCILWCAAAFAQFTPPAQHVLLIAPQLLSFAGSEANFQSLAAGLTSAATVTLTTTAADGSREIATFTPAEQLSPADAARQLEAARQRLIGQGLGHPSAAELAVALMGGKLITPSGTVTMPALIAAADPKKPLVLALRPFSGSRENYAALGEGLKEGRPITLKPATPRDAAVTFTPPGGPMSEVEAAQTLKLASDLLASQGIYDPTPAQVRAAIMGGRLQLAGGQSVLLRGVLEGRTQATAVSPATARSELPEPDRSDRAASGNTSDSPAPGHRSDTPTAGHTSDTPRAGHTSDRPLKGK